MHKLYISPSSSLTFRTYTGEISEATICRKISSKIREILKGDEFDIMIASNSTKLESRLSTAYAMGSDFIIGLQCETGDIGKLSQSIYYSNIHERKFGCFIGRELNKIMTVEKLSYINITTVSSMLIQLEGNARFFGEANNKDIPAIIIELGNISDAYVANYITNNYDEIANSIATGIINYFNSFNENNIEDISKTRVDSCDDKINESNTRKGFLNKIFSLIKK